MVYVEDKMVTNTLASTETVVSVKLVEDKMVSDDPNEYHTYHLSGRVSW